MKSLAIIILSTLASLVLWLSVGIPANKLGEQNKKVLETQPPVSGTIDVEFLKEISRLRIPANE